VKTFDVDLVVFLMPLFDGLSVFVFTCFLGLFLKQLTFPFLLRVKPL